MRIRFLSVLLLIACAGAWAQAPAKKNATNAQKLPYVYTKWEHFTVKDGLPNDHIFAVKADGPYVWVGTEDGLARLDKRDRSIKVWKEEDGLPFRVVTAIEVDKNTGDVWLGLFGGGLARFSAGRFDHFNQMNSGLVNDVVYGVAIEGDNVWAATTAGTSRYNIKTGQWSIFNEKNGPYDEIWNYGVNYADGKIYLAVWGGGVLEFNVKTEQWKVYHDPDREMEIDLYRDDGLVHNIVTAAHSVEGVLWVSSYFGGCRYDGRHWRGYFAKDSGFASDFQNNVRGRSANEAWFSSDKGLAAIMDYETDTWVNYSRVGNTGLAKVTQAGKTIETIEMDTGIPHSYAIYTDLDGNDVWVGTSKGLGHGIGTGYYPQLKERPLMTVIHNAGKKN